MPAWNVAAFDSSPEEQGGDFDNILTARVMGAVLWHDPRSQRVMRDSRDLTLAVYLFRTARDRYYVALTDAEGAVDYAIKYELVLAERYNGDEWRHIE